MRKILFGLFLLLSFSSFGQILEKSVTAVTKLETRGTFVYSAQTIPVLDLTYTQYGTTNVGPWHKVWTALDNYMRFSNDVGATWHVLRIGGIVYDNGGGTDFVVPNSPITPGTKTKITYDAKGLVTAGADATTNDIASVTNKRYVTDANLLIVNTPADGSHDGYLKKEDWTRFGDQADYEYWTLKSGTSGSTTTDTIFTDIKGGLLYNQYAVENSKGIAAAGWKVPSIEDFQTLREYIDPAGTNYYPGNAAGGPLKDDDPAYWTAPNTGATNEYGFNGRGNGIRHQTTGVFDELKELANYRTTTRVVGNPDPATAYVCGLFYQYAGMDVQGWYPGPTTGVSVRLIKDSSPSGPSGTTGVYVGNNGASYPTIVIGTQEWLATDLAETKYRTGGTTTQTITGGMLYNGFVIDSIANTGWHVPTHAEYLELANALGGKPVAGDKMRKVGTVFWDWTNAGATNVSKFDAVGTGQRAYNGTFSLFRSVTLLWNADMFSQNDRYVSELFSGQPEFLTTEPGVNIFANPRTAGFSIRLIKDATTIPFEGGTSTYTGNDGTVYRTIRIGTKEYTAENLIETKYVGGTDIPIVTGDAEWAALTTGAMCAFENTASTSVVTTGDAIPMITDNAAWAADVTGAMCAYNNDLTTVGTITTVNHGYGVNVYSKDTVEFIAGENIILSLDGKKLTISATSVPLNDTIVPSTKTKISYDKNGKVTAGADATTADIAPSTDRKYLTDAEKVVIGNTSGTNSGDNSVNTLYDTYINSFAVAPSIGYQWTCNSLSGAGYWANTTTPMLFLGVWDANANSPAIADGSGVTGSYYIVGTGGTWNSITFAAGDQVAYNGLIWQKITGTVYAGLTKNYVPKFDGSKFVNSKLVSTTTGVGINVADPSTLLDMQGAVASDGPVGITKAVSLITLRSSAGTPAVEFRALGGINLFIGLDAGGMTTGTWNTGFGRSALAVNSTGVGNAAFGYLSLTSATGATYNSSFGYRAGEDITTGGFNSMFGAYSLSSNISGNSNSAYGSYSLSAHTNGSYITSIGRDNLLYLATGSYVTSVGYQAGAYYGSGTSQNVSASNSTYLGTLTRASASGNTNEIVVGYNALGHGSNTARWGNTSILNHYFSGKINSDVVTGTAPFGVASTTKVDNLNADQLDGFTSSDFVIWVAAPATKTSTGIVGMVAKDSNYLYICTATNVWRRITMAANW